MSAIALYLGLDVHKDSTTMAIAEPGPKGEIRLFGTVSSDVDRPEKALRRIAKAHPNAQLEVSNVALSDAAPKSPELEQRRKRRVRRGRTASVFGKCSEPCWWLL